MAIYIWQKKLSIDLDFKLAIKIEEILERLNFKQLAIFIKKWKLIKDSNILLECFLY